MKILCLMAIAITTSACFADSFISRVQTIDSELIEKGKVLNVKNCTAVANYFGEVEMFGRTVAAALENSQDDLSIRIYAVGETLYSSGILEEKQNPCDKSFELSDHLTEIEMILGDLAGLTNAH